MASGHVNRSLQAEHMPHRPMLQTLKKVLATRGVAVGRGFLLAAPRTRTGGAANAPGSHLGW